MISIKTGVSCVCEEALDSAAVSLNVDDAPVSSVLSAVARRLGVQASRVGGMYFIGQLRPEDRGVLVRKVKRLSKDQLAAALLTLQSQNGRAATFDDGLVVVGDTVEVLSRVNELLDGIENAPAFAWVVQLHVISIDKARLVDLGLDVTPAASLALALAQRAGSPAGLLTGSNVSINLSAVLQAARNNRDVHMVAEPMAVLLDGEAATISKGQQVPIISRAVSPQGTSTISGVTYKQTGLQVGLLVRQLSGSRGVLHVKVAMDDVTSVSPDGFPTLASQNFESSCVMDSGGVYLLGSLERLDASEVKQGPGVGLRLTSGSEGQILQIWARCYRVGEAMQTESKERVKSQ